MALWEEKLQLRAAFAGNSATAWGTRQARSVHTSHLPLLGHECPPALP